MPNPLILEDRKTLRSMIRGCGVRRVVDGLAQVIRQIAEEDKVAPYIREDASQDYIRLTPEDLHLIAANLEGDLF